MAEHTTGVRLYGRAADQGSHSQVTAGFRDALAHAGLLAGFVQLDASPWPDAAAPAGALAASALFTGPLRTVQAMTRNARHRRRFVMVAPNSSHLPPELVQRIAAVATDLVAPSRWAVQVLTRWFEHPVHLAPHGVLPEFTRNSALRERVRADYCAGRYRVVHLSSSDRDRKGTWPMLQAWRQLIEGGTLPPESQLDLVLDSMATRRVHDWLYDAKLRLPDRVTLHARAELGPGAMAQALSTAHVVCQPSRGEAFGMVPLEARACGVPVVATACSGHSEHVEGPGVVVVEHGPDGPTDDLPGAQSPTVEAESIVRALGWAARGWPELDAAAFRHAPDIAEKWSWRAQLAPFIQYLEEA